MRYFEFAEGRSLDDQQKLARANERLSNARAKKTDAFRRCQNAQQKAKSNNDPEGMSNATRRFHSANKAADASIASATAILSKKR